MSHLNIYCAMLKQQILLPVNSSNYVTQCFWMHTTGKT